MFKPQPKFFFCVSSMPLFLFLPILASLPAKAKAKANQSNIRMPVAQHTVYNGIVIASMTLVLRGTARESTLERARNSCPPVVVVPTRMPVLVLFFFHKRSSACPREGSRHAACPRMSTKASVKNVATGSRKLITALFSATEGSRILGLNQPCMGKLAYMPRLLRQTGSTPRAHRVRVRHAWRRVIRAAKKVAEA